jgi:hypothetical protein
MNLVECVDKSPELCRLFFGAQLESLYGTPHDLTGRNAEGARLRVKRGPLLRRHQNHQSSRGYHDCPTLPYLDTSA